MFAILVAHENVEKIMARTDKPPHIEEARLKTYLAQKRPWYYITGYYNERSVLQPNTIIPQYRLDRDFDYDPVKIKTDWDQIVRK